MVLYLPYMDWYYTLVACVYPYFTGVGPAKAVNLIRKHKNIEDIMKHNSVSVVGVLCLFTQVLHMLCVSAISSTDLLTFWF